MKRAIPVLLLLTAATNAPAQDAAAVFAKAKGAVVTVTTPTGSGTGFIIGGGTLLVTCHHVIEGDPISGIGISLYGVRVASLLASDKEADVAIFTLTAKAPESLSLHSTGLMNPGSKVFVIGTPLGFLSHTITEGIVSGLRRTSSEQLLQITAPVSPGSSGSPVLNSSGLVVGMVTGSIERGQALNFAVSASDIRRVQKGGVRAASPSVERLGWWPEGNPRLADLASKLGSKELGDEAARKLVKEGTKAVPFLIAALWVFADELAGRHQLARQFLIAVLGVLADDGSAILRAADALVAIGKPAVEPLIRALSDSDEFVRSYAARHWGRSRTHAP